jgi:hypothetical protein
VLRGITAPQSDEVAGGWRQMHNEELHNLYSSPNIIRIIKLRMMIRLGYVAQVGVIRNVYKNSTIKSEGKMSLRRPRHSRILK